MQSDLRVHGERKVDRRCTLGQLNHITRWSEYEYLVLIKIQFQEFEKLIGRLRIQLQLEHLSEPLEVSVKLVRIARILLETPMRRYPVLCGPVHLTRANLDLESVSYTHL